MKLKTIVQHYRSKNLHSNKLSETENIIAIKEVKSIIRESNNKGKNLIIDVRNFSKDEILGLLNLASKNITFFF